MTYSDVAKEIIIISSSDEVKTSSDDDDILILDKKDVDHFFFNEKKKAKREIENNRFYFPSFVKHVDDPGFDQNKIILGELLDKRRECMEQRKSIEQDLKESKTKIKDLTERVLESKRRIAAVEEEIDKCNFKEPSLSILQKMKNNINFQLNKQNLDLENAISFDHSYKKCYSMNNDSLYSIDVELKKYEQRLTEKEKSEIFDESVCEVRNNLSHDYEIESSHLDSSEKYDLMDLLNNITSDDDYSNLELTPIELNISLMKHQLSGLLWLKKMENSTFKGGILADEMGLGKTIQIIALILVNKSQDLKKKTTLVVSPVSLLKQWASEIETKIKSCFSLKIGIYHGSEKKSYVNFSDFEEYDVILTSYCTLGSEWKRQFHEEINKSKKKTDFILSKFSSRISYRSPFYSKDSFFYRIVLDEAQMIKNKFTIISKAVTSLKSNFKFCLSGTPIQNNIDELYPIIRFLEIKPYNNECKFKNDLSSSFKTNSKNYDNFHQMQSVKKLRAILKAMLLRRTKNTLIDGQPVFTLPRKHSVYEYVDLEKDEKKFYTLLEQKIQNKAKKIINNIEQSDTNVLTLLLRLRQACCHMLLVKIGEMKAKKFHNSSMLNIFNFNWIQMCNELKSLSQKKISKIINSIQSVNDLNYDPLFSKFQLYKSNDNLIDDDDLNNADTSGKTKSLTFEIYTILCPVCNNIKYIESSAIFSTCGHIICHFCINSFFSNNNVNSSMENNDEKISYCKVCSTSVTQKNIIDLNLIKTYYENNFDSKFLECFCHSYYEKKNQNQYFINYLTKNQNNYKPSTKIKKCIDLIKNVFNKFPREKIIIFSQFITFFDLISISLKIENFNFLRYDGSMNIQKKDEVIKNFYEKDVKILMISLNAGNVGLTLTCASHVIIMDPFWNPFIEEQALHRAHRIGQSKEVYVHRILITNTVETRIIELQNMKKKIANIALDEKGMKFVSNLEKKELGFLFGLNKL